MRSTPGNERRKCSEFSRNFSQILSDQATSVMCKADIDGMCWAPAMPGTSSQVECPFDFCDYCNISYSDRVATRHCLDNGTWGISDYSKCRWVYEETVYCTDRTCYEDCSEQNLIPIITLSFSTVSTLLLIISLCIFSSFESIQCRRLSIHKHLAFSFVLRFVTMMIWSLTQIHQVFRPCSSHSYSWICKALLFMQMYTTMASTFWMFVEVTNLATVITLKWSIKDGSTCTCAQLPIITKILQNPPELMETHFQLLNPATGAYLASRFTVFAMRSSEGSFFLYISVGWVLPFLFVSYWAFSMEMQTHLRLNCWMPYSKNSLFIYLLVAPISTALVINVIFLLIVIVILFRKLTTSNRVESATIWKTIKATLLLVPLLGVSNLLLFFEPSRKDEKATQAYMVSTTVLQHSQGIFVAVLYCFLNSEIQNALSRWLEKLRVQYSRSTTDHASRRSSSRRFDLTYLSGGGINYQACATRGSGIEEKLPPMLQVPPPAYSNQQLASSASSKKSSKSSSDDKVYV